MSERRSVALIALLRTQNLGTLTERLGFSQASAMEGWQIALTIVIFAGA